MYPIVKKVSLAPNISRYDILAPWVARKAEPGQFIILRIDECGERIPLTIADYDREKGTVTIIAQAVGRSTRQLASLREGDSIADFAGPLGNPSELHESGRVICIGGGVGIAPIYPQVKELYRRGVFVDTIIGARSADLLILEDELRKVSSRLHVTTDDGTKGRKGFVTDVLKDLLADGLRPDQVIVIGPPVMMKFTCDITKEAGIPTVVSLNSLMVDGTGMCGGCRVTVGGEVKFTCIDGPEFDGHLVDFDELISRLGTYKEFEKHEGDCSCLGGEAI